jgi:hypothetical protein
VLIIPEPIIKHQCWPDREVTKKKKKWFWTNCTTYAVKLKQSKNITLSEQLKNSIKKSYRYFSETWWSKVCCMGPSNFWMEDQYATVLNMQYWLIVFLFLLVHVLQCKKLRGETNFIDGPKYLMKAWLLCYRIWFDILIDWWLFLTSSGKYVIVYSVQVPVHVQQYRRIPEYCVEMKLGLSLNKALRVG